MAEQKFNSGYSPIPEVDTVVEGPSLTEQTHMKSCDVNNIIKRYERTGVVEHVSKREPRYMDVSECPDYHESLQIVKEVEEMFSSMPAVLRDRFDNDAGVYLSWINDPENKEEAEELGLLPALPNEQPPTEGGGGEASGSSQKTGPETSETPPVVEEPAP